MHFGSLHADDAADNEREELRALHERKNALKRTSDILSKHDVVVQKLINKVSAAVYTGKMHIEFSSS